ncbi:MAG: hypothetical protein KL863_07355 [Rhizobium sp.]|nr:hypothetical protein [Rhizobium sp.]MBX9455842.1 hypothetical protein [Rhizobium sp.]
MFVDNWSGYSSFRYGKPEAQPKPKKSPRLLSPDRRRSVVNRVFDILKDWRSSPFENEGLCVAGLRAAFCLDGHSFALADIEARSIVSTAFALTGAARPSWAEGQPDATVPEENCRWCANEIPIDDRTGGRKGRFCSPMCARSYNEHRAKDTGWRDAKVIKSAYATIAKPRNLTAVCKTCGGAFMPRKGEGRGIYCSIKCHGVAHRKPKVQRACKHCGAMFHPHRTSLAGTFCSTDCWYAELEGRAIERWCLFCGKQFFAKFPDAKYCSQSHGAAASKRRVRAARAIVEGREYSTLVGSFELTCLQCGDEFPAKSTKEKFCGNDCQATNWRARLSTQSFACLEVR